MNQQRYSPEFKDEAVRQVTEKGHSVQEVAARLGVSSHSLYKWVKAIGPSKDEQRGDELLDETSAPGDGFLADTCQAWESATRPAARAGLRVVKLRIGVVLSPRGGALARMLPPFRWGLGGRLGPGRQSVSWIGLGDLVEVLRTVLFDERLHGPINAVAPQPVTNAELTRVLARVLRRPALLPVPAALIRMLIGEMGQALLLSSTRVVPRRLEAAGFRFRHPELGAALAAELER